uniref:Sodium/bile acid cotransporter n=1 Tax=Alexandrium catenella TaxID=2925 RepID=A0A7S1RWY8_ALECA
MGALQDFIVKNFLILGLLTVITFGLICPKPGLALVGVKVAGLTLPDVAIDIIFVVSGLALESFSDALQYKALGLGMTLVLLVTPLMAVPILYLPDLDPRLNVSLLQGMALFCVVPTTLSSGVTMITQAKGNVSLAILLTSVTNVLGVFTMSFSASKVFSAAITVSPWEMLAELIQLTLVPLCVGMALRRFVAPLREFAKRNKKKLGLSQNSCILFVVLLMISKAQAEISVASDSDIYLCLSLAAGVHLIYRIVGYVVATVARLPPEEWVTLVLMCSQKSLPVCVSVLQALPPDLRRKSGLFILPCVMAHAAQLIIDSMLAVRWQVQAQTAEAEYATLPGKP